MKRLLSRVAAAAVFFTAFSVTLPIDGHSQGIRISPTGGAADPSALLDASSTQAPYQGTLITRLTTAQRNSIVNPAQSLWIYNLDNKCFEFFENGFWQTMACATCPVPAQPSVITGTSPVCQSSNGISYSVTPVSGVTYSWTYSGTGFTCTSGCNTNSNAITVNFSGAATSGTLTCTPSGFCGAGAARTLAITVNAPPNTSNAGPDQLNLSGTSATLAANAANPGTGAWTIISGAGGSVTTPSSATSTFTGTSATSYVLRWTISNAPCTATFDEVTISFAAAPVCTIGSTVGGGKAFLLSGGKCYVSAAADGTAIWGSSVNVPGAAGTIVGTGQTNTAAIVAAGAATAGSASRTCDDSVESGFSDWYLPSLGELQAMWAQNAVVGLGTGFTFSSTNIDAANAQAIWGFNAGNPLSRPKNTAYQFRCIRSF